MSLKIYQQHTLYYHRPTISAWGALHPAWAIICE